MWNERPFDLKDKNPFNAGKKDDGGLSAESVKCPSCASNIIYMPEVQGMVCRNCGNIYHPSTLEKMGAIRYTIERDYTGDNDISEDDRKRHEIVCNSCGAAIIADEHMMSTMCPFCGSPTLVTRRLTREFKPDYIIPFRIDKKTTEKSVTDWLNNRKMTPAGFKKKSRLTRMTPLYVPFWLLDSKVEADLYGEGRIRTGDGISRFTVKAKADYYVKNVPFDASVKIANKLMEAIEPFDYGGMVKFDNNYLQGFYADNYDQLPTEMMGRIIKRLDRISLDHSGRIGNKYNEFIPNSDRTFTWMNDISFKYCLIPVWFMTVEFGDETYQVAVNGQTGKAGGQAPTTGAVDRLDGLVRLTRSKWKWVPIVSVFVLPLFLTAIVYSAGTGVFFVFLVWLLIILEFLGLASIVSIFVIRAVAGHASDKIHKTADVVNDFDKAPGLDTYIDADRPSGLKIEDHLLLREPDPGRL